jgi:hypothetical protein
MEELIIEVPSRLEKVRQFKEFTIWDTAAEVERTFENVRVITNPEGTRIYSVIKLGH